MKNILMTGGTGFVGSSILPELINNDNIAKILLLTRDLSKTSIFLRNNKLNSNKIQIVEGNITKENLDLNELSLKEVLTCDYIYHFAANISLSNKKNIININYGGTKNILDLFFNNKKEIKKFVYMSTAYAFGIQNNSIKERWILERPSEFRNAYEESKWMSEKLIYEYHKKYNFNYLIFRPTIIISEKYNSEINPQTIFLFGKMISKIKKKINIKTPINSILNFVSIEFLKKVFLFAERNNENNKIINVSGSEILIKDIAKIFNDMFSIDIKIIETNKISVMDNLILKSIKGLSYYNNYIQKPQISWDNDFLINHNLIQKEINLKMILKRYFQDE